MWTNTHNKYHIISIYLSFSLLLVLALLKLFLFKFIFNWRIIALQCFTGFCHTSWRRQWHPTPILWPGNSHGWRSLVGFSPWGCEESDTTEWLHFHFSLPCTGEGNGNPLQCSCLENPRDGGAWWAAVYGVAQSWTQLKRLSSCSSHTSTWISHRHTRPLPLKSPSHLPSHSTLLVLFVWRNLTDTCINNPILFL